VTEQKALKRRVRARMSKTGERYTAARRQVLAKASPDPAPPAVPEPPEPPPPAAEFRGRRPSDELVVARTGQPWSEWYARLEAWGARDRSHTEIARWLSGEQGVDGWWSQELTVRYEMAIGRRETGQRPTGYEVWVSKTMAVPARRAYDAVVTAKRREAWLPGVKLTRRTAPRAKIARFDWPDGSSRLAIYFDAKATSKTTVGVQHERLPDAEARQRMRAFWKGRLAELQRLLEAEDADRP
jgi:uncharacterized protein YndB with AHSA1/START domain